MLLLNYSVLTAVLLVVARSEKDISNQDEEKQMRDEILEEFERFDSGRTFSDRLFLILQQLPLAALFNLLPIHTGIVMYDRAVCMTCRAVVDALLTYTRVHSQDDLRNLVYSLCTYLGLQSEEVCAGVIDLNMDTVAYILNNTKGVTSSQICGITLQGNGCSGGQLSLQWSVDVDPGPKPEINTANSSEGNAADILTIVQISDIHHDPIYLEGGNAECGEPMCCRNTQGNPKNPAAAAGYWGEYRKCDTPWKVLEDTLQQVKKTHQKIDYIYMTGDIIDHGVWNTSIKNNSDVITKVLQRINTEFPDTPVYPILGNHEPSPLNVFAPHYISNKKISTRWLYELSTELWSVWLPPETKETILRGGFYTALAQPGFRIIALNNNVCYYFNWWLIYNPKDQDGQLQWLADTLHRAEAAGEKVHILGHIPSGDSQCYRTWSREFHRIIERFENTVTAIFNGHTHNDHFHVYYSTDEPTRPISVAVNGGSVTPFSDLNSNYKIYSVDSVTYNILDSETWIFNLTQANTNANVNPTWFKLYSFKDAYGVRSLNPTEMDKLTHKLAANRSLLEKYSRYYVKNGDRSLSSGCDTLCLKEKLCFAATAKVGDSTQCDILMKEYEAANGSGGNSVINTVSGYLKPLING